MTFMLSQLSANSHELASAFGHRKWDVDLGHELGEAAILFAKLE